MENNHIHEIYHTIEDTFDYLGKKWSIKIIKGFFCHCIHFKDFLEMNPDLSSKVLSERLKELEQKGIIEKRVINSSPIQTEYHLTVKGEKLNRIIYELFMFATETTANPSEEFNLQLKKELKDLFQV
jgi:DNA-binding HxlR family transcriptional regulator